MKVYYELDLLRFNAWSGGKDTLDTLTSGQIEELENVLPDIFSNDEVEDVELNDFLWFERDTIAEILGFRNWEILERCNNGESLTIRIFDIDWDVDDEEDLEDLPKEVIHTFDDFYDIEDNDFWDEVSDWLTDEYQFCHNGFDMEETKN